MGSVIVGNSGLPSRLTGTNCLEVILLNQLMASVIILRRRSHHVPSGSNFENAVK